MPKVLLVKTTSMGDLIHSMPAVTDLQRSLPDLELHWLVEESFTDIPSWHPFVKKVYGCATRRWRKSLFSSKTRAEMRSLKNQLRAENYDLVIDAQGLVKSVLMVRWLQCERHGYDKHSIREPLASRVYSHKYSISREQGAIQRVRQLFAAVFNYDHSSLEQDFGLQVVKPAALCVDINESYVMFLHGTNWNSKIWPVQYWQELAGRLTSAGMRVLVPWGSEEEHGRAEQIAAGNNAEVLERQTLSNLAYLLQNARAVVGSDTGLSHLAAALDTRTLGIYGSTSVELTGLIGRNVVNLQSDKSCSPCMKRECPLVSEGEMIPCYQSIPPESICDELGFVGSSDA